MKELYNLITDFITTSSNILLVQLSVPAILLIFIVILLIRRKRTKRPDNTIVDQLVKKDINNHYKAEVSEIKSPEKCSSYKTSLLKQKKKSEPISPDRAVPKSTPTSSTPSTPSKVIISRLKIKPKDVLPVAEKEELTETTKYLYVNYTLEMSESIDNFAVLRIPKKGCIIRSHRYGNTKRRGFKEISFQKSITRYFGSSFDISGTVRLNTGKETRPFEPDIALIQRGYNQNIRIDIEIDEPYAGITRQPIHCKQDDFLRDNYFVDRGWIVLRFSEFQVHTQEAECLRLIAQIISKINSNFVVPPDLKSIPDLKLEKKWDIVQAQKWEKEKYRENYLEHVFGEVIEENETTERDFNEQETNEEKLVKPSSVGIPDKRKKISFNKINMNFRDKRIKYYSESHVYTIDGIPVPSVTTVISRFFTEFDAFGKASGLSTRNPLYGLPPEEIVKIWKDKGMKAANKGTFLHEQIANYYLGEPYIETEEFYQFLNFVNDHKNLKPFRSEWRIFDETYNIAGTIDLLVKNENGSFDIYDWKRSKKVIDPFNGKAIEIDRWGNKGIGILQHIDDTSFNHYKLQQNLYRHILEKRYNLKIENMYLIVMHTDQGYSNYHKVKVPYLSTEIENILQSI